MHSLLCDSTAEAQYRVQGFASCHQLNKNITRLTIKLWPLNECSTRITSVNFDPSNGGGGGGGGGGGSEMP